MQILTMARTFILHDESINTYGFWMSTAGCDLEQFKRNPVMLWMHQQVWKGTEDEVLPIGHWENIRVVGEQILADAIFDETDPFAKKIAAKVDAGVLRMASAGAWVITTTNDAAYTKPGQTRETVLKWRMREASIVDIGGNNNALALYDENDQVVNLAAGGEAPIKLLDTPKKESKMKNLLKLLGLADNAPESEVENKVKTLSDTNQQLTNEVATLKGEKTVLEQKLADRDKADKDKQKAESITLVDAAVKDGRIDAAVKDSYLKLFEGDFESAKATLASLKPHKPASKQIEEGKDDQSKKKGLKELADMNWQEIDKAGRLVELKADAELYKEKFKERFGHEPK